MQKEILKNVQTAAVLPADGFSHVRHSLAYEDMHIVRTAFSEFLQQNGVTDEHIGNLLLCLTEVMSNLVKHPQRKADHIEIRADIDDSLIKLEVIDNSTPFKDFSEKCKKASSLMDVNITGAESGYGLGCIIGICRNPAYIHSDVSKDRLNHFKITYEIPVTQNIRPLIECCEKKIFLVDDDPVSLKIYNHMLNKSYQVIPFETAEAALAAFEEYKPDLVISDLNMPGMDGIELRKALSCMVGGDATPFIFLSGQQDFEGSPYISRLGIDDFLCKPVTQKRLQIVLERLLRRSSQIHTSIQEKFHNDLTELLKPTLPESYGPWKITTHHSVAEAGGGDFILHQETPSNMTVILADVMGHGRQAKFFSYVYAGYLRSMFQMRGTTLDASRFLRYLSRSVSVDPLLENVIMTCIYFHILPDGIVKIASAGHPHPILVTKNSVEPVNIKGPLPGLVGDSFYEMTNLQLESGDKIIFMTDGFLDAFDKRDVNQQKIIQHIQDMPGVSGKELADRLWKIFSGLDSLRTLHSDDATIVIAEYGERT